MSQQEADLLIDLIEVAADGTWPLVRQALERKGHTPDQIMNACNHLAYQAGRYPILDRTDFSDYQPPCSL
jgi:alkylhydroperoxidase/carboxymuconolactone decarboxylase family protein YurZ